MSFVKGALALFGAITLLGCTQAEITQPPVNIVPNVQADAVGLDVYARQRSLGNPVPAFRGQNTVSVRTWGDNEGSGRTELTGVPCTLDSGVYKAQFTTPANVIVPNYGPNSPALFVRCTTATQSGSVTANVLNMTAQQRSQSAAGTGLLGAIIIGAVNEANRDNLNDEFNYNPIVVQMR
ncbi:MULTISPECIES: hypothetical protein [unclassified Yoonia]|uniref:hypothetical protein n=1 Tax=unclassified Yoonia TaxID=2629118 RepID=UPI002AFDF5F0|nr:MULTISPECIES: hypothetical protein [unclassified Yoonia]